VSAESFELSWRAVPENVPAARHAVLAHLRAADTPDPPLNDIGLAVSEATTNVVNHAYVDRDPGPMGVRIAIGSDEIELTIVDEGSGMVPRPDTPGLGLGMPLIATVTDRFEVQHRRAGGTRLCLWFKREPDAATLPG
jgi:serine/threonine-protein kinase RsbW/stage II sporulation protein AB (anti-sigma F factor)